VEAQYRDSFRDRSFAPRLYTIGHGGRSAADFLDLLRASAIGCVADVRAYPVSRRYPQFSQKILAPCLDLAGIAYRWMGKALGGFRQGTSTSIHSALASESSRAYADHMNSAAFQEGIAALLDCARQRPTVLLCAERLPQHCHRALISDALTAKGVTVIHILDKESSSRHRLCNAARIVQGQLIYDQAGGEQLGWAF
jgi:uncharacterized protein (DUF488 family)